MTRSASDRELGEVHLFCHVHMSLPCTGERDRTNAPLPTLDQRLIQSWERCICSVTFTCHYRAQVDLHCRIFRVGKESQSMSESFSNFQLLVKSCWIGQQKDIPSCLCLLNCQIPTGNWTHPKLQAFVQARIPFRSVVHACAMGIEGLPGLPIKKAFRIMSSSEELCQRLEKRFHCACDFHASFNFSDFQLLEKYSRKFARFFVRMLALFALR